MISAPAFHVSGVVVDAAGRPVANAMVRLLVDEPTGPMFMIGRGGDTRTDASGEFRINNVTNGTYTLLAVAPRVLATPTDRRGGANGEIGGSGSFTSLGISAGLVGGTIGGGVTTEMGNGTTVQYRDDTATRVPITVDQAHVSGLEVVVRRPPRDN